MKISSWSYVLVLLLSMSGLAQQAPPFPPPPPNGVDAAPGRKILIRHEMGEWWRNSDTAKKLQLTDGQIAQLDQVSSITG